MSSLLSYKLTIIQKDEFEKGSRRHVPPIATIDFTFAVGLAPLRLTTTIPDCPDFQIAADVATVACYAWASSLALAKFDATAVKIIGEHTSPPSAVVSAKVEALDLHADRQTYPLTIQNNAYTVSASIAEAFNYWQSSVDLASNEFATHARKICPNLMDRILNMPNRNFSRWNLPPSWLAEACGKLC